MASNSPGRPLTRPNLARTDSGMSRKSVGEQMESNMIWNVAHPMYKVMTDQFNDRIREIITREGIRKASAKLVLMTTALTSDRLAMLQSSYTEFSIKAYPMNSPVHSYWVASIYMGNEWMSHMMRRHTDRFTHYGGSVLGHLFSGNRQVHIEIDATDPNFVHDNHSANLDVYRIYSRAATVGKEIGQPLNDQDYRDFLQSQRWVRCDKGARCTHQSEGLCVDLTKTAMSPAQVASAMLQIGAQVSYVMLPYHSSMLLSDSGELPNAGVHFQKTATHVEFKYPQGVAGVLDFPLEAYSAWVTGHVFKVGEGKGRFFQLELLHSREFLMFAKLIEVPQSTAVDYTFSHALEMPEAKELYLVRSWEMKSLSANPALSSSWKPVEFLANRRVVDRTYQHALTLKPEEFTRYNVRKQLQIANNRVVLQGTSVTVNPVLSSHQIDQLVYAVFSRAFVERFNLNTLTTALMTALKEYARFGEFSLRSRMVAIFWACSSYVWDWTIGVVDDSIRRFCDYLRRAMGSIPKSKSIQFDTAPSYVQLTGQVSKWKSVISGQFESISSSLDHVNVVPIKPTLLGGLWAQALRAGARVSSANTVSAAATLVNVSMGTSSAEGVMSGLVVDDTVNVGVRSDQFVGDVHREVSGKISAINEVDEETVRRHNMDMIVPYTQPSSEVLQKVDFVPQPDYIGMLTRLHDEACPGVAEQNLEFDTASISLDPQDRTLAAPYLKMPSYFGDVPKSRKYYRSKIQALGVPMRQQTIQELVSAMAARNLSAPQIALQQDNAVMFAEIWQVFLATACLPDAKAKLTDYQHDPVALGQEAIHAWMLQSTTESLVQVKKDLEENSRSLHDMPVNEYIAMLKSDVKPPLSTKPINTRIEPQVIVYHEKPLSALYSSIFRVLVRRFLSLLRPQYCVNLLKDLNDVREHIAASHVFGGTFKYLENDFSKYDKSQGDFAFGLEEYVFKQLGLNDEMLSRWVDGHVKCTIRSLSLGISLHVMYQRKSGDATTAFGNVILNVLSVTFAYKGTDVVWAVFMGDDSLVCARKVAGEKEAVQVMAEVFNLQAKYYITDAPYFASSFILIDDANCHVSILPDPVKRAERWSMSISADDPLWDERWTSANDTLQCYKYRSNTFSMGKALVQRYSVSYSVATEMADAIATAISTPSKFRQMWEENPSLSLY